MILIIDNYDSFVYNLARYISELGYEYTLVRNDQITLQQIATLAPTHIVLSPGPKTPSEAGICCDVIKQFGSSIPILGICLGHQAIGHAYGGLVTRAVQPLHGQSSVIHHDQQRIFINIPNPLTVGRYHSLIISRQELPDCLEIIASSELGEIMAVRHKLYPVFGVQFHPESILTQCGYELLRNFFTA